MNKKVSILLTVLIIVLGIFFSNVLSNKKQPLSRHQPKNNKAIKVMVAQNNTVSTRFKIEGRLYAYDMADIYAEVSGVLLDTKKRFKEGHAFKKGEPLVNIDDAVYKNQVYANKSGLMNQITLLLPDLSIDFPESAKKWEAYLNSFKLDEPLAELPETTEAQEKYYITSRNIYNLYYSVKAQEETLAKYSIKAPFDGTVTLSSINPGTLVRQGQKLGEFTSTQVFEMVATPSINEVKYLHIGQKVKLTCNSLPGVFTGTIKRINDVMDLKTQSVKVYIQTTDKRLKAGLFLEGFVDTKSMDKVVRIEQNVMVGESVFTVNPDSTLSLTPVNVEMMEKEYALISGIADGALIVNQALTDAEDGDKVLYYLGDKPPATAPHGKPSPNREGK